MQYNERFIQFNSNSSTHLRVPIDISAIGGGARILSKAVQVTSVSWEGNYYSSFVNLRRISNIDKNAFEVIPGG